MCEPGKLTFFCGKMGAGKSTLAQRIAEDSGAILLSEDEWLATLYPEEILEFADYQKYSARLKPLLRSHVQSILMAGLPVVMDFPGNTKTQRAWFREVISMTNIPHQLVYLELDDRVCLEQIGQRRITAPERAHFDTEEVFHQVTSYFQPPSTEEGFNIEVVRRDHEK